ncbi:MAG: hypothetical protein IJI03_08680 [Rudaea sp.]|nr:hypothetical protein [Rudaea sp.]MBR0345320.1 hypothetical protein [Rudaea sp.]
MRSGQIPAAPSQDCHRVPTADMEPVAPAEKAHTASRSISWRALMASPVALFHFRLNADHGIGRVELLKLWAQACHSTEVSVSRVESGSGSGKVHTYSLFGPTKNLDIRDAENRMRDSLAKALPKAALVLRRY